MLALLPAGIVLALFWIVWTAAAVGSTSVPGLYVVTGILGLLTAVGLMVKGWLYRRDMGDR